MTGSRPRHHLLVLTQHYAPDPNFITEAVSAHVSREARVTVVTSHPNYPNGSFAPGFRFWRPKKRVENGVTVWRLQMIPDRSSSIILRAISCLSFTIPAMIAAPLVAPDADVVRVYQTPFTTALAAWYHKLVRRSRIVLAAAGLWPERFLSAGVVRHDWLMKVSFAFRRWMNALIRTAVFVKERPPSLRFDIYGVGSKAKALEELAASLDATNLAFKGSVPPAEAFRIASTSLSQVGSLRPTPLFRMTVPSKLIFCLAAGTPILAGLDGEADDLAIESGAAISFDAASAESLTEAIVSLAGKSESERAEMGKNGQRFYVDRFEKGKSIAEYRNFLLGDVTGDTR